MTKQTKINKKIIGISITILLFITGMSALVNAQGADTTLDIASIEAGFGQVVVEIENTGDEIAENIEILIEVKGGVLGNIDVTHVCSGCSGCGTTLDPGAIKTESSAGGGFILGLGSISVRVLASALNAPAVEKNVTGFVIGPIVLLN